MTDDTRGERLQIMLTEAELAALDTWRFNRRMPSRASAVRELLKRGMAADGFQVVEMGSKSRDFGVIEDPPQGFTGAPSKNSRERPDGP